MSRARWLAVTILVVAVYLLFEGYHAVSSIYWTRGALTGADPFVMPFTVEEIRELQPLLYVLAFQGFLGVAAVALAGAVLAGAKWAHSALLIGSAALALSGITVIALRPHLWDVQAVFILFAGLYVWEFHVKNNPASAL